jgi:hypothetical protein
MALLLLADAALECGGLTRLSFSNDSFQTTVAQIASAH